MEVDMLENNAHGIVPDFGAIFMSSSMTRKECFKRRLFGLPYWLSHFVRHIKSGMILFLFEYERRVLHGVFQASSDGAMNIVPHAYSSSGKQFPAQVRISVLWRCTPISEDQFRDAIKENYFSANKFNFGLSEEQVHRLLSLFSLTRLDAQLHLRQLSGGSLECSSDRFIGEGQDDADDDTFILNRRLQGKHKVGEDQVNTTRGTVSLPHYNLRNITSSPENLSHYSHVNDRNLTYDSGFQSKAQNTMPSLYGQVDSRTSMPFQAAVCSENIVTIPSETESQKDKSCSVPNLHYLSTPELEHNGSLRFMKDSPYRPSLYSPSGYTTSLPFQTTVYSENITRIPSATRCQDNLSFSEPNLRSQEFENDGNLRFINASQYQPSLYSQSKYMTSMPFQTAAYSENITAVPSETQCQINESCSEPNLQSLPTQNFENDGSLGCINTSQYPVRELNYNHPPYFPDQYEQNIGRHKITEENYMFDAIKVSNSPPNEQTSFFHGPECYRKSCEGRDSVFSRLVYPTQASIQECDDYAGHEKYCSESSIDEVMFALQQYHQQWERTKFQVPDQVHKHDKSLMKKKRAKSSISSYSNSLELSNELRTSIEDNMAGNRNHIAAGTPFVNFKRRRKTGKIEDDSLKTCKIEENNQKICRIEDDSLKLGRHDVKIESDQFPCGQQKRRKLIRPSFAKNESCDREGKNDNVSSDLQDALKESRVFGERAGYDPSIKIKTEKLPQNAELLDFIPLVNNEDTNISCGSGETKISWSPPRRESKDGNESCSGGTSFTVIRLDKKFSTDKGLTLKDQVADKYPQNLNDSGLSNQQELYMEPSKVNAGNSVTMVDDDDKVCNEQEIVEEQHQGICGTILENKTKRPSPQGSSSDNLPEELIDERNQNNENRTAT